MALNTPANMRKPDEEKAKKPEQIEVTANLPYPPIMVERPNLYTAKLLSVDLGADKSELTSVMQYVYHSWQLDEGQTEMAKTLLSIAKVEMHHMEILGRLIILLGGNPTYSAVTGPRRVAWNANMVTYSRMIARMMQDDILLEQAAIRTYRRQLSLIDDRCVTDLLERIIMDEEIHLRIYKQFLSGVLK